MNQGGGETTATAKVARAVEKAMATARAVTKVMAQRGDGEVGGSGKCSCGGGAGDGRGKYRPQNPP